MFEIVREAQGFDVFLKAGRDLTLMSPESIALEFAFHCGVQDLYFA
jgi:hypothetical protein